MMKLVFIISALLLNGCFNQAPPQLYLLQADSQATADPPALALSDNQVIGLGPIHLPEYLNRPQIITEVGENRFRLDDEHRWAERLDQNISRTLLRFLSGKFAGQQVVPYPWPQKQAVDYQINIEILTFHQSAGGYSRLEALWRVLHTGRVVWHRKFDCSIAAAGDADKIVKAQSECLTRLGNDIVDGLQQLANQNRG